MERKNFICIFILWAVPNYSSAQILDLFENYETRLNNFNSTLRNQQRQINSLATDILAQQIIHDGDIRGVRNRVKLAEDRLDALTKVVNDNFETTNLQLGVTELLLLEQTSRVDKLNSSNQLWRANFQVVNRTFAELKKKLTLVVPIRSGSSAVIV